jgi:hypothetical protein
MTINNEICTSAGQRAKLAKFEALNHGRTIMVYCIDGDARSSYRSRRKAIAAGTCVQLGHSSGCASARDNFHATYAEVQS